MSQHSGSCERRSPAAASSGRTDPAPLLTLLAALYAAPPEAEAIASLRRGAGATFLADLRAHGDPEGALAGFAAALAGPEDDAELAHRLAYAFGLLFLGIGGPATIAPYESFHRYGGRLFQAPTSEMDGLLAAHGLSPALAGEPADHLSIEMALLAHLVATGHPDRHPLAERLAGWVPLLRDELAAGDATGFFAAAARLVAVVVDSVRVGSETTPSLQQA